MGILAMKSFLSCASLLVVDAARVANDASRDLSADAASVATDSSHETLAGSDLIVEAENGMYRITPHLGEALLDIVGQPLGLEGGQLAALDWDMETAADLGNVMQGIVHSAQQGDIQPLVTGTCRMVQLVLVHTGCPPCGLIIDIGMQILFQDDGAENTLWDQVSQQVRQEIDEALLVTQFDRVDKYMQAFKVQISDSPFFVGQATRENGPSLETQYMWFQVLDHDLAVNVGEFVPPAVHPSSGQPVSARQREPFLTVATLYMTARLAILGKMRFLASEVLQIGGETFLGTSDSIERAIAQIDRKALTAKRDLVPPLAVLYYELMEPGVMSFNRRHDITRLARHTLGSLAPSNCLMRQRELRGAQWRIPNLDHCIVPPIFQEPETGYPLTREVWSESTFPHYDPYEPRDRRRTGAARCRGQYAMRSIVCTGQDDRGHAGSCAGADAKILCARVHDSSEQGGYGALTTTQQFGTSANDGRLFALCPDNFFAYGVDFDTSFSLLCQSHSLVTMLDETIFQRSISSESGQNGVCDLNMLKGVVVGMRCAATGCPLSGEGAVVVLCKLLVTQKEGSIVAPGQSLSNSRTTTPNHLLQYSSVDLRSDHFPTTQTLSAKIAGLEGNVVDPGFCPLLPKNEIQFTSCRSRLISALTCNNGDAETLRSDVNNELKLGQHFVFHFYQAEANAVWNFTTDFADEELVVTYLDNLACKPNNGADSIQTQADTPVQDRTIASDGDPRCEQVTPNCGEVVPAGSESISCDRGQLRAHVSLDPPEVGWHVLDVYTALSCSTSWMSTSACVQQLDCQSRWRVSTPSLDGYEFLDENMLYNGQEPVELDEEEEL